MKDAYYFPHDYDTMQDEKIRRMIRRHGMAGYGLFWAIIELLYINANALQMDCEGIAQDFRVNSDIVESVICDFNLFIIRDNEFGSLSVERRLNKRNEKSRKARESANCRWTNANALPADCEGNAIKKKKGKKIKDICNGESKDSPAEFSFENVWEQYGKKGNRKTSKDKWDKLSNSNKALALKHIPGYVDATPDKQYRKNFETYINKEAWNDNIISNGSSSKSQDVNQSITNLDEVFDRLSTVNK